MGQLQVWFFWSYLRPKRPDLSQRISRKCVVFPAWRPHTREEIQSCFTVTEVSVEHRKLPADALGLLRASNAALWHLYAYHSSKNRSSAGSPTLCESPHDEGQK
ncbi:hypothetical protein EVAR_28928_1 [Eumeta japonica]|uniref:Uncharacterized protein n=1 Tax=Eumeta variegata TaxID=151549 RepID=A0A4C1YMG8_EUMVA|nr:hypothetical protein EVAR_28928_1 [Eumeta japonica]